MSDTWRSGGFLRLFFPKYMALFDWPKCLDFQDGTCQQLIGLLMSSFTRAKSHCLHVLIVACVIAYTRWTA